MPFNKTRSRVLSDGTCRKGFGGGYAESMVFDATTLSADGDGRFIVPYGTIVALNPSDVTKIKAYTAAGGTKDVQTVTITGTPTGGSFKLSYEGDQTAAIPWNATAAQVATALNNLPTIAEDGGVTTSGGALPGTGVVVTFKRTGDRAVLTSADSLTGGTTPASAIAHTTPGVTSTETIVGILDKTTEFWGNTAADDEPIAVYSAHEVFDTTKIVNWSTLGADAEGATALRTSAFR